MKKAWLLIWLLTGVLCLAFSSCAAEEAQASAPAEEPAEWTLLFYFCGSDLESKYSYATSNIEEIMHIYSPESYMLSMMKIYGTEEAQMVIHRPGKVNILMETGGCTRWHREEISADALQRWSIHFDENHSYYPVMDLKDTLPLANMAEPETLSDFIRWGTQNYPAKKYALVLWDHGGGALTGLFADELFNGDYLNLSELKTALGNGGVTFEAVVIDACLMANIETAYMIKDYAHWMIASEEEVPGKGTAVGDWIQELLFHPEMDGRTLGRIICDKTLTKYANDDNQQARTTITWSVIDLTRIDPLITAMNRFFQSLCDSYKNYPRLMLRYADAIKRSEEYGNGEQKMRDIGDVMYSDRITQFLDLSLRNEILDALMNAVDYTVRGIGRSGARGLSFCYPINAAPEKLDIYAQNCPSMHYLAFLDAVTDWTAPDSIYASVERLTELTEVDDLKIRASRCLNEKGFPVIAVNIEDALTNMGGMYYRLYRVDNGTGEVMSLGRTDCVINISENMDCLLEANEPWMWPYIDDYPCTMDLLVEQYTATGEVRLYNIPVQISTENQFLRCGRYDSYDNTGVHEYEVYGVWEKYDDNSQMTNRNVIKLSQLAGQEYRLIAPLEESMKKKEIRYMISGATNRLFRNLDVVEKPLPPGIYFLEYEIDDLFMHQCIVGRFEMRWDGEKITFPDGFVWEGDIEMEW